MFKRLLATLQSLRRREPAVHQRYAFEPLEPRLMLSTVVQGPAPLLDAPVLVVNHDARAQEFDYQRIDPQQIATVLLDSARAVVDVHGGQAPYVFKDADGDSVAVQLIGPGVARVKFDATVAGALDILSIRIDNAGASTSLIVNVTRDNGEGITHIGRIVSESSLHALTLNEVEVDDEGVTIDGALAHFTARALSNGADVVVREGGSVATNITLQEASGHADNPTVISLAGAAGKVHIQGNMTEAAIATSGNTNTFIVDGGMFNAHMLAGATLGDGLILRGGTFRAATINSASVGGDMIDSVIAAGGDPGADHLFEDGEIIDGSAIHALTVGGVILGANSPHINPGIYSASLGTVNVNGINLIKDVIDAGLGVVGNAVIDPLPAPANALTVDDVKDIIERAVAQATLLGVNATISIVDREGNFLAVVRMEDGSLSPAARWATLEAGGVGGLEAIEADDPFAAGSDLAGARIVPTSLVSTTKAGTAAYLSTSDGNAFTTRTAGQIIQTNFPPGVTYQDGGPLFGVQLSSLPTSDVNNLPLGISADPGGVPLYRGDELIGGIGVEVDGVYTVDRTLIGGNTTVEEQIALAGQSSLEPTGNIRADMIFVDGIRFDYSNGSTPLIASLGPLPDYDALVGGALIDELIPPAVSPGSMFSVALLEDPDDPARVIPGEVPDASLNGEGRQDFFTGGAFDFVPGVDGLAADGSTVAGSGLTTDDVQRILFQAHELIAFDGLRAQIRRDSPQLAQVSVSVVDVDGNLLGSFRTLDAPIFGYDVSVQKARTAAFFSRPSDTDDGHDNAGGELSALDFEVDVAALMGAFAAPDQLINVADPYDRHVDAAAAVGVDLDGSVAVADRTGGFLSRPDLPDGIAGFLGGPFSAADPDAFSVFNTGLQTVLMIPELAEFLLEFNAAGPEGTALAALNAGTLGGGGAVPTDLTAGDSPFDLNPGGGLPANSLANGMQIFAGSVPLYKDGALVGGIGVSGDGIEQDDYISFTGATGFQDFGAGVTRADSIILDVGFRLPYIKLPRSPFAGV